MALCRYMIYLPQVGRQKRWGWVQDGMVYPLDDQEVMQVFVAPDEKGLSKLANSIERATEEPRPFADLDVTPGRYGVPSLVAPVLEFYPSQRCSRRARSG